MVFPKQILEDLKAVEGFNEAVFLAAHSAKRVTSVRVHPEKKIGGFEANEKIPWCDGGYYLPHRPVFTLDPAYHAGAYYVQEASSMFLQFLFQQIKEEGKPLRVLDLCAAPGGKSTLIASLLDKESLLLSNEVIRTRASILEENCVRWGYTNNWVTCNDPRDFSNLTGYFDIIVVDAPCSGSGLFRKEPDWLNQWTEDNVLLCSNRQKRILSDVLPALKENGVLIYATCSYSTAEDEVILDWAADDHELKNIEITIPNNWGVITTESPKNKIKGYRFLPDRLKGEGFFISAMRKAEHSGTVKPVKYKAQNDKKIKQEAGNLLIGDNYCFIQNGKEDCFAFYTQHEQDWQLLRQHLYLRKAGVRLGSPAQKEWLPAHDVALSIDKSRSFNTIEVNKDQALQYLKRNELIISDSNKGWFLVNYEGLSLGWLKNIGNRTNNYLPKHWRIRMELNDE